MKKIELKNRYGDVILITKEDYNDYYTLHTNNLAYISEHYEQNSKTLAAIDPEGLHLIAVGDKVDNTNDVIKRIKQFGSKKYRLYV